LSFMRPLQAAQALKTLPKVKPSGMNPIEV
jgi:hypothetical protein